MSTKWKAGVLCYALWIDQTIMRNSVEVIYYLHGHWIGDIATVGLYILETQISSFI